MDGNVWRPALLTPEQMEERSGGGGAVAAGTALPARNRPAAEGQPCQCLPLGGHAGPREPARPGGPAHHGMVAAPRWRPGPRWGGSGIGALWRRALRPSAGLSRASRPCSSARRTRDYSLAPAGMVGAQKRRSGSAGHFSSEMRPGTTWARCETTPVLRRLSNRREVSSIVAITPDGRLYARHFHASISSDTVILALRYVRRKIDTPLLVVWDRLNASGHRSPQNSLQHTRRPTRWPICRPMPQSSTRRSSAMPASNAP
jgi:hypothetical protein